MASLTLLLIVTDPLVPPPSSLADLIPAPTWNTSQIEWTLSYFGGHDDGLVERFLTRSAGDSIFQSNFGDERGFHETDFRTQPPEGLPVEKLNEYTFPKEESAGTRQTLLKDNTVWQLTMERPLTGVARGAAMPGSHPPIDLSSISFAPSFFSFASNPLRLPPDQYHGFESAVYRERFDQNHRIVEADYGNYGVSWYLDRRRGNYPVKTEFYDNDNLQYFSETKLQKMGERWVPWNISYYREDQPGPYKVISIQSASFDEDEHDRYFEPSDIGAVYGSQFWTNEGPQVWDGVELITTDEFSELMFVHGLLPERRIIELLAKPNSVEHYLDYVRKTTVWMREAYKRQHGEEPWLMNVRTEENDPWDVYVEDFIKKHQLPEPAVKRAKDQLERAKKVRDAQRRKNHKAVKEAERRRDTAKLDKFKEREERIFKEMLVRPLDRLAKTAKEAKSSAEKGDESAP